jgi:hypothetical protein
MKNLLFVIVSFLVFGYATQAQQSKVQSAYMYHFTKYMEWPSAKQSGDFVIAVVGNSDIHPYLKTLAATKTVGAQKIVIKEYTSVAQVTDCHMIFVAASNSHEVMTANAKAARYQALVITEKKGLAKKGASLSFVMVGGKAKFEVNESSINKNGIKVSAKLIQMGISV